MLRKAVIAALCFALLTTNALAANAYITEFAAIGGSLSGNGTAQIAVLPPLGHQKVDFSGGAATATALGQQTKYIRVHCDAACSIRVGGTADITYLRIPLDGVEYFGVQPAAVISVIANP